jgi:hypothetical protein
MLKVQVFVMYPDVTCLMIYIDMLGRDEIAVLVLFSSYMPKLYNQTKCPV